MPIGEGWWIDPKGYIHRVDEHLEFIKKNPELFGFTKEEAEKFTVRDRDRILLDVMKDGWVRVRDVGGGRGIMVETWLITPQIRRNILDFLYDELGFAPYTKFMLSELSRRFYNWVTPEDIKRGSLYYLVAWLKEQIGFLINALKVNRKKVLAPLKEGDIVSFVIHDHKATRHHWDLRIEWPVKKGVDINKELIKDWEGKKINREDIITKNKKFVYRSWAIPKHRLPIKVGERLMISETELHPIEYGEFEGKIEEGKYGAGEVKIYDSGNAKVLKYDKDADVLVVHLKGSKIDDIFSLVPAFKRSNQWLILKVDKRKWLK